MAFYAQMLDLVEQQRTLAVLFIRHRTDPLALGGIMYRLDRDLRDDLKRDLERQLAKAGGPPVPETWVAAVADYLLAASWAAIEALLLQSGPKKGDVPRLLAGFTVGACMGALKAWHAPEAGG